MNSLLMSFKGFLPPHAFAMGKRGVVSIKTETSVVTVPLVFLGEATGDLQILFNKMIEAMKVDRTCVAVVSNPDAAAKLHPKVVVSLGVRGAKVAGAKIIETHSLENLAKNPALKKETWEHLKLALKELA